MREKLSYQDLWERVEDFIEAPDTVTLWIDGGRPSEGDFTYRINFAVAIFSEALQYAKPHAYFFNINISDEEVNEDVRKILNIRSNEIDLQNLSDEGLSNFIKKTNKCYREQTPTAVLVFGRDDDSDEEIIMLKLIQFYPPTLAIKTLDEFAQIKLFGKKIEFPDLD